MNGAPTHDTHGGPVVLHAIGQGTENCGGFEPAAVTLPPLWRLAGLFKTDGNCGAPRHFGTNEEEELVGLPMVELLLAG